MRIAMTGTTLTITLGGYIKVFARQGMAVLAVGLVGVVVSAHCHMLSPRQRFEVLGVHAKPHFAAVVQVVARGNWTDIALVDVAVSRGKMAITRDNATAAGARLAAPDMTRRIERAGLYGVFGTGAATLVAIDEPHGPSLDVAFTGVRALGDRRGIAAPTLAETVRGHGAGV